MHGSDRLARDARARARKRLVEAGLFVALVTGCSFGGERRDVGLPATSVGVDDDDPKATGGDDDDDGDGDGLDDDGDTDAAIFDLGAPPAADGLGPATGCTKIDFLFVIDNSRSMQGKQAALAETFAPFMQAIEAILTDSDVHVMAVDTDAQTLCTPEGCADPGENGPILKHCLDGEDTDAGYACQTELFDACDTTLGAGVVHPAGNYASNMPCPVMGDKRYLDESDDLVEAFQCVARVGTAGDSSERPIDAMLAAIDPANACNTGFLRDDAILVVTFITDDQCWEDAGTPDQWKADIVAAKGGDEDAIVVLGLLPNTSDCQHGPEACDTLDDVIDGQHWLEFVQLFGEDHGISGSVCATESFADLFESAVGLIATTCEEFVPPG